MVKLNFEDGDVAEFFYEGFVQEFLCEVALYIIYLFVDVMFSSLPSLICFPSNSEKSL